MQMLAKAEDGAPEPQGADDAADARWHLAQDVTAAGAAHHWPAQVHLNGLLPVGALAMGLVAQP